MRLRSDAVALAWCAMLSCASPPQPARPGLAPGVVKRYRPLEMASDARRADRAVILGTDDANGSTVLVLPPAPTPVVVDALSISRGGAGPPSGAVQAIVLGSAPGLRAAVAGASAASASDPPNGASDAGGPSGSSAAGASLGASASSGPSASGAASGPGASSAARGSTDTGADAPSAPAAAAGPVQVDGADEGPAGARWRAEVWSAALVAASALGKDAADLALSATPAGPIDGPASALVAAGFVAVMLGDTLDPAATLTGAIEPDGTIGPVAGLPEQLAAAIARGKTRIGVPAGMRVARSAATGKDVDLVRFARDHRAEAIELGDVRDGYQLLTGHRLPAPVPVAAAAMALDAAALDRLDARYAAWQRKLAGEWVALLQLEQAGRKPAAVTLLVRLAHTHSERAEALHRAGKPVAAYGDMLTGWLYAAAANQTYALSGKLAAGDADGTLAALAALDTGEAAIRASFGRIAARQPATLAGHLAMIAALQATLRGWAFHELAADSLRTATSMLRGLAGKPAADVGSPATAEAVSAFAAPAVLGMLRVAAEAELAEQELELAPDDGVACSCAPADLARVAAALQRATAAALGHVDALIVDPLARKAGIAADAARWRVAALEPEYLIADQLSRAASSGLPHELAAAWTAGGHGSLAAGLLALAAPGAANHSAALVIARYDALAVHRDDSGRIDAVNHPQAFRALLAGAERAARAAARTAQVATGAIPVQARLTYQAARIDMAGPLDDQVNALDELWTATAYSQTAVALARSCR